MQISVMKRSPAFTKNEIRPKITAKSASLISPDCLHRIEHGDGGGQRVSQLLHRRRACFLQVIGADVGRVPARQLFLAGKDDGVLDQFQRRRGRKDVGTARQIFLDDVVLDGAGELAAIGAGGVGSRHIERQQPGTCRVDGHRRIHAIERDAVQQRAHIAEMGYGHADLANLAAGQFMIAVVAGLGGQIEGNGKAGLALGQIA